MHPTLAAYQFTSYLIPTMSEEILLFLYTLECHNELFVFKRLLSLCSWCVAFICHRYIQFECFHLSIFFFKIIQNLASFICNSAHRWRKMEKCTKYKLFYFNMWVWLLTVIYVCLNSVHHDPTGIPVALLWFAGNQSLYTWNVYICQFWSVSILIKPKKWHVSQQIVAKN